MTEIVLKEEPIPQEIVNALKKPLPPEAIKDHPTKPYLSTIKVPYVIERLNEVFGLNGWAITNEVIESNEKMVVVKSVLTVPKYGIRIEQFGGNDNTDKGDAYKGACTDALSKCASYIYIGMDVYKGLTERNKPKAISAQPAKAQEPAKTTSNTNLTAVESTNISKRLRALGQDSRILKNYIEKTIEKPWKDCSFALLDPVVQLLEVAHKKGTIGELLSNQSQ